MTPLKHKSNELGLCFVELTLTFLLAFPLSGYNETPLHSTLQTDFA